MNKLSLALSIYRKFVFRDCLKNPVRTWITIFGIALGVSVFLAISLANRTALSSFKDTVDRVAGRANLEVRPTASSMLDQSVLKDIQWLWDEGAKFTPLVSEDVVLVGDKNEVVRVLALDILADDEFKNYESGGAQSDPFKERGVLVGGKIASDRNLQVDSKLKLLINDRECEVVVAGILNGEGAGSAYGGRLMVMDISLADEILDLDGQISQIEIIAPKEKFEHIQRKLNDELPDSMKAEPASTRTNQVEKMTKSFEYNLFALSFIALLVGMFLIYNTMAITVIRRRPEIGTIRVLGVSSKNVMWLMLSEAMTLGVVGSFTGIIFGVLIANWALSAVASTYKRLYFSLSLESVSVDPTTLLVAFATGVGLTVVAAIPAAIEGAMVSPSEATRRMSFELAVERWSKPLMVAALVLFVLSFWTAFLPALDNFPVFGYISAFLSVIALALSMPLTLKVGLPALSRILHPIFGVEAKLAISSLVRTLGRTSVAVATLSVGLAMLISLAIMIASFRQTVIDWANQTLVADLWMRPSAVDAGDRTARFKNSMEKKLAAIDGVEAVAPWVQAPVNYNGMRTTLGGAKFKVVEKHSNLNFLSGRPTSQVASEVRGNKCIVSESFSIKHNSKTGDIIEIPTKKGLLKLKIVDIYYDYVNDSGFIVINRPLYEKYMDDRSIQSFAIYVADSRKPDEVRQEIYNNLRQESLFLVRTTGELRNRILDIFDDTFAVTYALHTISVFVAILSVMNALFALTEESKREFGILKYIGACGKEIKKMVYTEAGILGVSGCIFGTLLGLALALILIFVINKQSFGWTVRLLIPFDFIWQTFLIIIATSMASAIIPARMASRTPAPEVVRSE